MTKITSETTTHAAVVESDRQSKETFENIGAALIFILIGGGALLIAFEYPMGSVRRMGPGAFPLLIAFLIGIIGVAMLIIEIVVKRNNPVTIILAHLRFKRQTLRAVVMIMLSLLSFAVLIRPTGLLLATAVMTFISTRAEPNRPVLPSLLLAISFACAAALIFIYAVGLPIPLWW